MVFIALYTVDAALKQIEKTSGKKFEKRKLLIGSYDATKAITKMLR